MGNEAQRMNGKVGTKALEKRHHQMGGVDTLASHGEEYDGNSHSGNDLQTDLLHRGKAEIPPLNDFDVIIGKANRAESEHGAHDQPDERFGKIAPQQCGQKDGDAYEHSAHGWRAGLLLVVFGTVFADVLADLKLAQLLNDERPDQQRDEHRGKTGKSSAKRQIPEDAEGPEVRKKFLIEQPVKKTSSAVRAVLELSYRPSRACLRRISGRTTTATSKHFSSLFRL